MRVIKVVETKVSVYSIKGNLTEEQAVKVVEEFHKINNDETIHPDSTLAKVRPEGTTSQFCTKVEYQLINERPEDDHDTRYRRG